MPVRIRYRTDHRFIAELKGLGRQRVERDEDPTWCTQQEWDAVPPAEPGDCWRIGWYGQPETALAGYDICCIKCRHVHAWSSARECQHGRRKLPDWEFTDPETDEKRMVEGAWTCAHRDSHTSCWNWSGTPEGGNLTASPSLHCVAEWGGCGYHGSVTNGVLSDG